MLEKENYPLLYLVFDKIKVRIPFNNLVATSLPNQVWDPQMDNQSFRFCPCILALKRKRKPVSRIPSMKIFNVTTNHRTNRS